jgi:hypothetical protein
MTTISGDGALAKFREGLTGRSGLDLVRRHGGRVLVQLPVGVGKSWWIDAITREAAAGGDYDLVVVLCPTRQLIDERQPLRDPPGGVKVVNLRPRPARECGPGRDADWKQFEAADLGALGRREVCGLCPLKPTCFWPRQYGKALQGARIVYATQAHLERSPGFLVYLRSWAKAERMLTLLDEASFVGKTCERTIAAEHLDRFVEVLREAVPLCDKPSLKHKEWLSLVALLQGASTEDLQAPGWRTPYLSHPWAAVVQGVGWKRFGDSFRFLGYDLIQFSHSPIESRRRDDRGNIQFSVRPYVGDCIIFSGTSDRGFTRYRLGIDLASPFDGYRFVHPDTRWYNLASPIGARKYFARHAPQVLDFFTGLIGRQTAGGKRVLLVAKKCFTKLCAAELAGRFTDVGLDLRVVTEGWSAGLLADPRTLPLINYGMIGTNLFEGFDAVFCLTGYYVDERVVNACLQDVTRRDLRLPIQIETVGNPRRRRAHTTDPDHRYYDVARLAQPALEFQEHHTVIQAVGRVRPFTRPREVITFQMAELPGVVYDAEFATLAEARRFFGIPSRRERRKADLAARIGALRGAGLSQAETARLVGVSERTVRNYEKGGGGKDPS